MTIEEAAKALLERVDKALEYRSGWELMPSIQEAADALRSALSASPWVSVRERLPTEAEHGAEECVWWTDGRKRCETYWKSKPETATHWMPIPPLPQQEG